MRPKFLQLLLLALIVIELSSCVVGRPRGYRDRDRYKGNHRAHWHHDGHGERGYY